MADLLAVGVRIKNLDVIQERLGEDRTRAAIVRGMTLAAIHVEGEVKDRTPTNKHGGGGRLAASITHRIEATAGRVRAVVGTNVFYGQWVEKGTGLFVDNGRIRPKNAQFLHFFIGGQEFFRRSIKGMEGRHMFRDGLKAAEPDVHRIIGGSIVESLRGVA